MIRRIIAGAAAAFGCLSLVAAPTAAAQPAPCGPDQATALETYLAQKLTEARTERYWAPVPVDSNYDPCADLSTILLTVEKATGSSPVQALMFNRGQLLGAATTVAYGLTTLDKGRSTPDMVVLDYKTPGECNACPAAAVTSVRYQWRGDHVEVLDPLPPI